MSVLPFMFIGVLFCISLLYLFVLKPFGIPTAPEERAHSIKFTLEMVLGIPIILIVGWAGIFIGILLWSIFVNLLSLEYKVEQSLRESSKWSAHYRTMLLWGLSKTKLKTKLK
jgi:hypothetical protein